MGDRQRSRGRKYMSGVWGILMCKCLERTPVSTEVDSRKRKDIDSRRVSENFLKTPTSGSGHYSTDSGQWRRFSLRNVAIGQAGQMDARYQCGVVELRSRALRPKLSLESFGAPVLVVFGYSADYYSSAQGGGSWKYTGLCRGS